MTMRRVVRRLKWILTGRKEEHKGLEANHVGGAEKRRRTTGVPSGQYAVALAPTTAEGERSQQARAREDAGARERRAAIVIQKTFRGYLARRALRALRSLVKIQALVRGYLVRKQAAMTLHRLQTLMRLQADSIAVKNAPFRKSMEHDERIFARDLQTKPPAHRRRLSDSTDSNYERSPRIVEMDDTGHLRSRSSRITTSSYMYNQNHLLAECHRHAAPTPSCSPLPGGKQQPARLSFRRSNRDPRGSKPAQTGTPRLASSHDSSPAKSVDQHGLASTPRRRDRDGLVSPRYMAGTASSAARTRCHSAPRQRRTAADAEHEQAPRTSVGREGAPRRSCSHAHGGGFCFRCSDATRTTAGFSGIGVGDEAARDYYLDSF